MFKILISGTALVQLSDWYRTSTMSTIGTLEMHFSHLKQIQNRTSHPSSSSIMHVLPAKIIDTIACMKSNTIETSLNIN